MNDDYELMWGTDPDDPGRFWPTGLRGDGAGMAHRVEDLLAAFLPLAGAGIVESHVACTCQAWEYAAQLRTEMAQKRQLSARPYIDYAQIAEHLSGHAAVGVDRADHIVTVAPGRHLCIVIAE